MKVQIIIISGKVSKLDVALEEYEEFKDVTLNAEELLRNALKIIETYSI